MVTAATAGQEMRSGNRTNLYLAASLRWPGGATAVRVRNLSATGAMIEAPVLPHADTPVELLRGALSIRGVLAWSRGNRAGLKLADRLQVREWMAPAGGSGQQRVDGLVEAIRSGDLPAHSQRPIADPSGPEPGDLRLASELLEQLGDVLVSDMDVVGRHGRALQSLDVVGQMLEALARAEAEPRGQGARLADLRASARAALSG